MLWDPDVIDGRVDTQPLGPFPAGYESLPRLLDFIFIKPFSGLVVPQFIFLDVWMSATGCLFVLRSILLSRYDRISDPLSC